MSKGNGAEAPPLEQPPIGQQMFAVPAHVLKAAIDLIDEEIVGKKGRAIANALEQAQMVNVHNVDTHTSPSHKQRDAGQRSS